MPLGNLSGSCLPRRRCDTLALVGLGQMFDLGAGGGEEANVEGMPPETYMERFAWDEAKYPPRRPLKDTVDAITDIVAELEDSLKVVPAAPPPPPHRHPRAPPPSPLASCPPLGVPPPATLASRLSQLRKSLKVAAVAPSRSLRHPQASLPFTRGRLPFLPGPLPSELRKWLKIAPVPRSGSPGCPTSASGLQTFTRNSPFHAWPVSLDISFIFFCFVWVLLGLLANDASGS